MVSDHSLKAILILTIAALACSDTAALTPTVAPPLPAIIPTSTPFVPIPQLTVDMIRNAPYQINARDDHAVVQLSNGQFLQGTDPGSPDYTSIFVSDFVAFGDLDFDGVNEAAAIIVENYGGTGQFTVLAVYRNEKGTPVLVTTAFIDDRPVINALSIDEGEIFLDATVHDSDDPGCCPTLGTTRRYALVNNTLRLTHFATSPSPVGKHEIEITSPPNGSEVNGSVRLVGKVTMAPFESNLVIHIYDLAGTELSAGPVQVLAPGPGLPGTFDDLIDLHSIPLGTVIYIELQDTSAADGSLIAMDSVQLVVK